VITTSTDGREGDDDAGEDGNNSLDLTEEEREEEEEKKEGEVEEEDDEKEDEKKLQTKREIMKEILVPFVDDRHRSIANLS
jgi:hypothetical protein